MDKHSFVEKLKLLNLPLGEYYILSSGSLILYGLREQVGDIDLCVFQKLFGSFLKNKYSINVQWDMWLIKFGDTFVKEEYESHYIYGIME